MNKDPLMNKIHDVIENVGINPKWNGYYFTARIIQFLYESEERLVISRLYRKLAKEFNYGVTEDSIERNVRYCFEHLDYNLDEARRIFALPSDKNSISIKAGLYAILDEVKLRMK